MKTLGTLCLLLAAAPVWAQGIYTCVDSTGRRLTSDRPILECLDREQRELTRSGATRRVHGPTLTARERQEQEARTRAEAERQAQLRNQQRLDAALLARYPNRVAHDLRRQQELAVTQQVIDAAKKSQEGLNRERQRLEQELGFYEGDPAKAPAHIRRGLTNNTNAMQAQEKTIANQQAEQARINARFDEELKRLAPMWQVGQGHHAP